MRHGIAFGLMAAILIAMVLLFHVATMYDPIDKPRDPVVLLWPAQINEHDTPDMLKAIRTGEEPFIIGGCSDANLCYYFEGKGKCKRSVPFPAYGVITQETEE